MKYIESWLKGLGLEGIIPKLEANGITTPKKLAALSLKDMYEVVGVEDAEERKKLYFLVQRLQKILNNKSNAEDGGSKKEGGAGGGAEEGSGKAAVVVINEDMEIDDPDSDPLPVPKESTDDVDVRVNVVRKSSIPQKAPASTSGGSAAAVRTSASSLKSDSEEGVGHSNSEEDLRKLRRRGRPSIDPMGLRASRERVHSDVKPGEADVDAAAALGEAVGASAKASRSSSSSSSTRIATSSSRRTTMGSGGVSGAGSVGDSLERLSFKHKDEGKGNSSSLRQRRSGGRLSLSSESLEAMGVRDNKMGGGMMRGPGSMNSNGMGSRTSSKSSLSSSVDQPLPPPPPAEVIIQTAVKHNPAAQGSKIGGDSLIPPAAPSKRDSHASSGSVGSGGAADVGIAAVRSGSPIQHVHKPLSPRTSNDGQLKKGGAFNFDEAAAAQLPPTFPMNNNRNQRYSNTNSNGDGDDDGEGGDGEEEDDLDPITIVRVNSNYEGAEEEEVEDMPIRVVVRKRPLNRAEMRRGDRDVLEAFKGGQVLMHEPKTRVDLTRVVETSHFVFDDSFESGDSNEAIYARTVKPLVSFAFEGGKASCFAYGQTGSGKTFTLMGANPENPAEVRTNAGLYVLAARDLFSILGTSEYAGLSCYLSCFEIYGGKLFDLLNDRNLVKCLEDAKGNVRIPALNEFEVSTVQGLLDWMSKAHDNRSIGCTGANETSSRSHLVMQLLLKKKKVEKAVEKPGIKARRRSTFKEMSAIEEELGPDGHGKITFIDLAGSERGADTTHNSKQTRMEGADINTSLLALKEVIRALANRALEKRGLGVGPKQVHTPFRGSKLTQVLKDSFVGDMTRTCMIACVSPAHSNCEHTLNTLRYADRVKEHQSNPDAVAEHACHADEDAEPNENLNHGNNSNNNNGRGAGGRRGSVESSSPARGGGRGAMPSAPEVVRKRGSSIEARPSTSSGPNSNSNGVGGGGPVRAAPDMNRRELARPSTSSGIPGTGSGSGADAPPRRGSGSNGSVPQNSLAPSLTSKAAGSPHRGSSPGMRAAAAAAAASGGGAIQTPAYPTTKTNSWAPAVGGKVRPGGASRLVEESMRLDNAADAIVGDSTGSVMAATFADTANLARTVSLLSAHKKSISETVQSMKSEMELVQAMEDSEDRNVQGYISELTVMLDRKESALNVLKEEVEVFKNSRQQEREEAAPRRR